MVTNRFDSTLPKVENIGSVLVHRIGFAKKNPTMGFCVALDACLELPMDMDGSCDMLSVTM